jgi:flagellar motor switch/type III secretory pathway protein FliN
MSAAALQSAPPPGAEKSSATTDTNGRNVESRKTDGQANAGQSSAGLFGTDEDTRWGSVLGLPCQFTVDLPLPSFRVRDFLGLRSGSVIATGWRLTRDVPLRVNGTLIGWGEFEGVGKRLGIRLTDLA